MSEGLYLKFYDKYIVAAPYNLAKGPEYNKTASARHYLAGLVPGLAWFERGDLARFKAVKGWKIVHEVGQHRKLKEWSD